MSSPNKIGIFPSPPIEPELLEFIDEVLVPALVRAAMADLAEENRLASSAIDVANSPRSANE
jgi:hypothetical protein